MNVQFGNSMMTSAVKNIMLSCLAIFLFQTLIAFNLNEALIDLLPRDYHQVIRRASPQSTTSFDLLFGLVPFIVLSKLYIWQFVSYMFLHGGIGHIFFNMFALWLFGIELERTWGTKEFLKYYFLTGTIAGVTTFMWHVLSNLDVNQASGGFFIPTIGASGAIFGILAAYALFFPDREIYLNFLFPIKAKYLVVIYGLLELFSLPRQDGISHISHLGGMVAGYFYLRNKWRAYGIGQHFFRDFFKRQDRW